MKQKDNLRFLHTTRQDATKIDLQARKTAFQEIYTASAYDDVAEQADRCISCSTPFCQWKCPVHNHIPGWLKLVYQNKLEEAVDLCHETNSLPEVCGRVCPHDRLCEGACTLNDGLGAVTIGAVEKYITDTMLDKGWRPEIKQASVGKSVAIVGSGPAGLACADVLVRNGFSVTVFDAYPEIGGLLTFGIPEFKLEKQVLQTRRQFFSDLGVNFICNTRIGVDKELAELQEEFNAVFLAIGTYKQVGAGIGNESHAIKALDFLVGNVSKNMQVKTDYQFVPVANKRVIVLGGGDTAMDCTRTSIRLGAKSVTCVYRRDAEDMPGSKREVTNAREEGINFIFNRQPLAIVTDSNNKVTGVQVIKTANENQAKEIANLSEWDKLVQLTIGCATNAAKKLYQVPDSEEFMAADVIVTAFGFRAQNFEWLKDAGIATDEQGRIITNDALFGQTSVANIFAGGDAVNGSDLVVTAIDAGRKAAESISKYCL